MVSPHLRSDFESLRGQFNALAASFPNLLYLVCTYDGSKFKYPINLTWNGVRAHNLNPDEMFKHANEDVSSPVVFPGTHTHGADTVVHGLFPGRHETWDFYAGCRALGGILEDTARFLQQCPNLETLGVHPDTLAHREPQQRCLLAVFDVLKPEPVSETMENDAVVTEYQAFYLPDLFRACSMFCGRVIDALGRYVDPDTERISRQILATPGFPSAFSTSTADDVRFDQKIGEPVAALEIHEPPTMRHARRARKPKRKADRSTEARDKWIYEQCVSLVPYDTIARRLTKKPKSWARIESKQGIRAAAERYAKRHKLPDIPARQSD